MIGMEVGITAFDRDRVGASVRTLAGRVSYDVSVPDSYPPDSLCLPLPRAIFLEDAWTAGLGARISYELQPAVRLTAGADVLSAFQQQDDQMLQPSGSPCFWEGRFIEGTDVRNLVEGFDFPTTIPLTFGLSVAF